MDELINETHAAASAVKFIIHTYMNIIFTFNVVLFVLCRGYKIMTRGEIIFDLAHTSCHFLFEWLSLLFTFLMCHAKISLGEYVCVCERIKLFPQRLPRTLKIDLAKRGNILNGKSAPG